MYKQQHDQNVRDFFHAGKPETFQKGEVILRAIPADPGVHYIDTGYIKVYSISDQGEEYVQVVLGPGDIYPLVWAYLGLQPDIYYEALTECLIWRVPRNLFTKSVKIDAQFSYTMAQHVARQLFIYSDRVDNLEYKKPSERLAYRLLFLAHRFGVKQGSNILIDANITHEVIANSINLARETVSREFERFARKGLVERIDHKIIIKDIERLNDQLTTPNAINYWGLDLK